MAIYNVNKKVKKSVKLSDTELKQLVQSRKKFHTDLDCSEAFGINRVTLKRIMVYGSGNQLSVTKIQKKLKKMFA